MSLTDLRPADLGWDETMATALPDGLSPARVACRHRGCWTLLGAGPPLLARITGRLRHDAGDGRTALPAVGDWVAADPATATIHAVLPRRTVLSRSDPHTGAPDVLAANVDLVLVVTSATRELNARRLERFVALATGGGARCVALLNKADLVADIGPPLAAVRAAVGGEVPVLVCSAQTGAGLDAVASLLAPGETIALLGSSGVGKSTLANALLGAEVQVTAPIRAVDDRGRHATVRRELLVLPSGALLVDTPGLKLPRMSAADGDGDAGPIAFADITALAAGCRYADCAHEGEPGCAVTAALEAGTLDPARVDALRLLQREQRWAAERASPEGRAARRARERALVRAHRKRPTRWDG